MGGHRGFEARYVGRKATLAGAFHFSLDWTFLRSLDASLLRHVAAQQAARIGNTHD